MKLVYGFGIHDYTGPFKNQKVGNAWYNMLKRCYDKKLHSTSRNRSYQECSVDDSWKFSSDFCKWSFSQRGFYYPNSSLDKDILVPGNKTYGPDNCSYIPYEINNSLTFNTSKRGNYPLGIMKVRENKEGNKIYQVGVNRGDLGRLIKSFDNIDEAVEFYKKEKSAHLSYLADKYKEWLENNVYETLKNYHIFQG